MGTTPLRGSNGSQPGTRLVCPTVDLIYLPSPGLPCPYRAVTNPSPTPLTLPLTFLPPPPSYFSNLPPSPQFRRRVRSVSIEFRRSPPAPRIETVHAAEKVPAGSSPVSTQTARPVPPDVHYPLRHRPQRSSASDPPVNSFGSDTGISSLGSQCNPVGGISSVGGRPCGYTDGVDDRRSIAFDTGPISNRHG